MNEQQSRLTLEYFQTSRVRSPPRSLEIEMALVPVLSSLQTVIGGIPPETSWVSRTEKGCSLTQSQTLS